LGISAYPAPVAISLSSSPQKFFVENLSFKLVPFLQGIGIEKINAGIPNFSLVPDYKNAGLCELSPVPDLFRYR
jgi:hypothetical protein